MEFLPSINKQFNINYHNNRLLPNKKFGTWSMMEDYLLLIYVFDGISIKRISELLMKYPKECKSRFLKMFGTTDWVKVVTTPKNESRLVIDYIEIHYFNKTAPFVWDDKSIEETYNFLQYYGFG